MKSYDLYIFNLDVTLIHTVIDTTKKLYPRFVDYSKAVETLKMLYQEDTIKPVSGVHHLLDILRKHHKFLGIYSSCHPSLVELYIRNNLSSKKEDFDFVFSTVEQQIQKPSPHIVYIMMEKYRQIFGCEIRLDKVLIVGDSIADLSIAKNASVDFAAVLTGPTIQNDFLRAGLDNKYIFSSIKEVLTPPKSHGIVAVIQNKKKEFLLVREARLDSLYIDHWSGPHGKCENEDVLEEETVVRETQEECGVIIKPLRKLYTCCADTKVNTVSFWEAALCSPENFVFNIDLYEVNKVAWVPFQDIIGGKIPLYPGTKDFFKQYMQLKEVKHE